MVGKIPLRSHFLEARLAGWLHIRRFVYHDVSLCRGHTNKVGRSDEALLKETKIYLDPWILAPAREPHVKYLALLSDRPIMTTLA